MTAAVEVHTLLSASHIDRYAIAARSLLRFWPTLRPVVHDDGSMTATDRDALADLVPGTRVIERAAADREVEQRLRELPLVLRVRAGNPRIMQITDYFLLAGTPRIIGMDSDVVFFRRPTELIEWAGGQGRDAAFAYSPELGWTPKGIHWLPDAVPGMPYLTDMCCGFVCADVAEFFDADYLAALMGNTDRDILFRPRFVTQMMYALMAGRLAPDRVWNLGERYRSGRLQWLPEIADRTLCHYFGSHDDDDGLAEVLAADPSLEMHAS